jgi:hypothetical protein
VAVFHEYGNNIKVEGFLTPFSNLNVPRNTLCRIGDYLNLTSCYFVHIKQPETNVSYIKSDLLRHFIIRH